MQNAKQIEAQKKYSKDKFIQMLSCLQATNVLHLVMVEEQQMSKIKIKIKNNWRLSPNKINLNLQILEIINSLMF